MATDTAADISSLLVERTYVYVSVAPHTQSGRPCIGGTRFPAEDAAVWWWIRLHTFDEFWKHYGLTRPQILVACWYMATYGPRLWRRRWGAWAKEHGGAMWSSNWENVPEPPQKEMGA